MKSAFAIVDMVLSRCGIYNVLAWAHFSLHQYLNTIFKYANNTAGENTLKN